MTRVQGLLLAALVASSLFLVKTSYEWRQLFSAIQRAETDGARLDQEHKRLEADRQKQATHSRVEQTARERLRMRNATPAITHYVVEPAAAGGH